MRKPMILAMFGALAGCSAASAQPDANDDLDCAVLAYYYMEAAKAAGTVTQQHATFVIHGWYAAKMQQRAAQSGKTIEQELAPGAPLLAAVQKDPKSMAGTAQACANRAVKDPHFDDFARSL